MPEQPLFSDTPLHVEHILLDLYRRMTPAQRAAKMLAMCRAAGELAAAGVRRQYPDASEEELRLRTAARWLPADLMRKAYGFDPDA
ncbi:MAG: hypothetical protein AB7K09_08855 [Planctomycetota bacterium]